MSFFNHGDTVTLTGDNSVNYRVESVLENGNVSCSNVAGEIFHFAEKDLIKVAGNEQREPLLESEPQQPETEPVEQPVGDTSDLVTLQEPVELLNTAPINQQAETLVEPIHEGEPSSTEPVLAPQEADQKPVSEENPEQKQA